MKKIPTMYFREYDGGRFIRIRDRVMPGCEFVAAGRGEATEKVDGSACAIIGGAYYKRYDANVRKGRLPPVGGIACQPEPDHVTGHWPFWVPVNRNDPADRHLVAAYDNTPWNREDGTYEAIGRHFQANPYGLDADFLERHGRIKLPDCPRDFEGIREYLRAHEIEGIVWWLDGEPRCKIKRTDYGFPWPIREGK